MSGFPEISVVSADARLARAVAVEAGEALLALRDEDPGGGDLRARGDALAQRVIAGALARGAPGDAWLSEEAKDDSRRLDHDRVWIVDPLDGTREFAEPGRTDWAVHVALWQGGDLVAGAVALPGLGVTFATDEPLGLPPVAPGRLRVAVSRTRPPAFVTAVVDGLGGELVPMGSAGAKVLAVVRGEVDAYVHAGGQYEWDSAAPVVVARAAGAHTSRIDGSTLVYNRPDPWLPDLVVCRPEVAGALLAALSPFCVEGAA